MLGNVLYVGTDIFVENVVKPLITMHRNPKYFLFEFNFKTYFINFNTMSKHRKKYENVSDISRVEN